MTTVYANMVADLFHWGHVEFLRQARALGDVLIVGIHGDDVCASYKRRPILTLDERVRAVQGCRYVDRVLADAPLHVTDGWIDQHAIDLVVHGDDMDESRLEFWYRAALRRGIFRAIPYTEGISSSAIIARVVDRVDDFE
jgi:cytidyltransferase-like protein